MTSPPPPPPGNYPPPPPGGGYNPPPQGYRPPPPPPPPGGGYPPPPAPQGGYAPPPVGGAPGGGLGPEAYTPWLTRVLAWLVDWLPPLVLIGIGSSLLAVMQEVETVCVNDDSEFNLGQFCATGNNGPSTTAWILFVVLTLVGLAYLFWNSGYKQGTTGTSIGTGIMKFKVVSELTGQPIGFGMSAARVVVYLVAYGICGIVWLVAVLFPLWDPKRQTLVDKVFKTVCLPI